MPTSKKHYRVTLDQVLRAHNRALLFGGRSGIRDLGLIESAIARPYCGYYRPIAGKAAALVHSLALNHGFIDGNKRTALYTVVLMLNKSGYTLRHKSRRQRDHDMEAVILSVVERKMSFDELVRWFHQRIVRIK